jgi:Holliday junction resolvase-like predicted endonuclease
MVNSRAKGKRGEHLACEALRALGIEARRSVQYSGEAGDDDLITSVQGIGFEVKNTNRLQPYPFLDQASRQCKRGSSRLPVVVMKSDNREFLIMFRLADLWSVLERFHAAKVPVHDYQQPEA